MEDWEVVSVLLAFTMTERVADGYVRVFVSGGGTIPVCFETKINGGIGLGAYEIDYDD